MFWDAKYFTQEFFSSFRQVEKNSNKTGRKKSRKEGLGTAEANKVKVWVLLPHNKVLIIMK